MLGRITAPQRCPQLNPCKCEYVRVYGKGELKLQMELMLLIADLEMEAYAALSGWAQGNHMGCREGDADCWQHENLTSQMLSLKMEGSSGPRNVL